MKLEHYCHVLVQVIWILPVEISSFPFLVNEDKELAAAVMYVILFYEHL